MKTLESQIQHEALIQPIALDLGEADIETAMQAYLEFLELPAEIRESLRYPGDGLRRNTSAGYTYTSHSEAKNTIDTSKDNKHIFHYTPDILGVLGELARSRFQPEALSRFVNLAVEVYESAARATRQALEPYEDHFPGLVGIHFPKDGTVNHHLRFLAYEPGINGVLARGHYDKSTATIAIAESHGGLRIGTEPDDLELYRRDPHESIFFHGLGWVKLHKLVGRESQEIPAWHDVVETTDRVNEDIMRWALIYFINPAYLDTAPSAAETHTPLNLQTVGKLALEEQLAV